MTQKQFEADASLVACAVTFSGGDMQVTSLAFEYIALNFKRVRSITSTQFYQVIFTNDIESESFYHYIKSNLPI